jgi:hypothetical protein
MGAISPGEQSVFAGELGQELLDGGFIDGDEAKDLPS